MIHHQLNTVHEYIQFYTEQYGCAEPNIEFYHGYIEDLDLPVSSFDVIVSSYVLNLSPNKPSVLKNAYKLLKYGGKLYFSDIYSDRIILRI